MSLCCCAHVISTIPEASTTSRTALRQPRVDGTPAWTACLVRDARGTVSAASCMQKLGGGRLRIAHGPARGSVREEAVLDLCLQALNIKLGPTLCEKRPTKIFIPALAARAWAPPRAQQAKSLDTCLFRIRIIRT